MAASNRMRYRLPPVLLMLVPWLIFTGIMYVVSQWHYLLFHSLTELFSVSVSAAIFMLAWNTRRFMNNDLLFFIGCAYLFAGIVDLFHALAYKGMGVFPTKDANLPTQLWIAARYLQSISLFSAVLLIRRKINQHLLLLIFSVITALLLASIAAGLFPDCYVNGLTPFKKISEYIISLILVAAVLRLRGEREVFHPTIYKLILLSLLFTIISELFFTFYMDVYGLSNFWGHIFKIFAVYCIYKSLIETGLNQPFDLLFRNMKKHQEELENSQQRLREVATHDRLTGLPNRLLFEDRLAHALEKAQRMNHAGLQSMVQVIIMDMDNFKHVNDRLGHLGGDQVLKEIAQRLKVEARASDTVARWGGDEFTCILEDISSVEAAEHAAQKLLSSITLPMQIHGQELKMTVSLGFSLFPLHGQDQEDLLRNADAALYFAKQAKNNARMYAETLNPFPKPLFHDGTQK